MTMPRKIQLYDGGGKLVVEANDNSELAAMTAERDQALEALKLLMQAYTALQEYVIVVLKRP
jgi:hypothetical protein